MKRILASILASVLVLFVLTGCAGQPTNNDTGEASNESQTSDAAPSEPTSVPTLSPTATATPTTTAPIATYVPTPTPELEPFAPVNIFGSELNPFCDVAFPYYFNIYSAAFSVGDPKFDGNPTFVLSMTASPPEHVAEVAPEPDVPDKAITFLLKMAGVEDEESINQYLEEYNNVGFCEFGNTDDVLYTIRKTDQNDESYSYVDGCQIDLCVDIASTEASKYIPLVSNNINVNALSVPADYFDVTPDFDECGICVNLDKNFAETSVTYDVVDVSDVQEKLKYALLNYWFDKESGTTWYEYGMIEVCLVFDPSGSQIKASEKSSIMQTSFGDYTADEVSLTSLGFDYFPTYAFCWYLDNEAINSIRIHQPAWGNGEMYENIDFSCHVNGYNFRMIYYADQQLYSIYADDTVGSYAQFDYYVETGEYGNEWSSSDSAKDYFRTALDTQDDDVYAIAFSIFDQKTQELFGMSLEELYALPPT